MWGCEAKKEWSQLVQALQSPLQNETVRPLPFKHNTTDSTESVSFLPRHPNLSWCFLAIECHYTEEKGNILLSVKCIAINRTVLLLH